MIGTARHAGIARRPSLIRGLRSIGCVQAKGPAAVDRSVQLKEIVEKIAIHRSDLMIDRIAHEVREGREGVGRVLTVRVISHALLLAGPRVHEGETANVHRLGMRRERGRREQRDRHDQPPPCQRIAPTAGGREQLLPQAGPPALRPRAPFFTPRAPVTRIRARNFSVAARSTCMVLGLITTP